MKKMFSTLLISSVSLAPLASLTGCESLPGNKKEQGAVIGGVGGAAAGAAIGKNNRILGALIGGAFGAGGGYLVGSQLSKSDKAHHDEAIQASRNAEARPATAADVNNSNTADLNRDGYVTLDEVVAMRSAGLSDQEMIRRLQATGQIFELTTQQEQYLREHNVDNNVIDRMRTINQDVRDQAIRERDRANNDIGNQPINSRP